MSERRPYTGSCHCGFTKYILFLTLPPPADSGQLPRQRFYRCNCTSCHKAGFFHVRTKDGSKDFMLVSPLDPFKELGDYQCFDKQLHWFFCKNCGMRCFLFAGDGSVHEQDLAALGVPGFEQGAKTKVWQPDRQDGRSEEGRAYLSVNAYTLDAKQEGLDMREWTEKKWVLYLNVLEEKDEDQFERPAVGGAY